ncbi:hypothetical protein ASZ78_001746 [Callipepla squamata]|uniref:PLAT domain-containing protein n=1 Tax=Callipepla squamata TaxID=9009 RepID=A0A226M9T2_CALSU|nr:hypothetical protein ASZ78_001746 [Callipepla squamata]
MGLRSDPLILNPKTPNDFRVPYYFPCQRWLAVDEDDGQVQRELVPVDEAFVRKDPENSSGRDPETATLGLEQKGPSPKPLHFLFPLAKQEVESVTRRHFLSRSQIHRVHREGENRRQKERRHRRQRLHHALREQGRHGCGSISNGPTGYRDRYQTQDGRPSFPLPSSLGMVGLKSSKLHRNKFERGKLDEFTVECVDIGELRKIKIGHDNTGTTAILIT